MAGVNIQTVRGKFTRVSGKTGNCFVLERLFLREASLAILDIMSVSMSNVTMRGSF